jgi:hypothetical protein
MKERIIGALLLVLFFSASYFHLNDDLWNDEIYTLNFFVFKGLSTILTDYHVPNNHIFANLLYWGWVKLWGIGDIGVLLDAPWKIRVLPGLISLATAGLLVRTASGLWGQKAGMLGGLLLLSGVTFGSFAFQVRGYPLTLLAAVALTGYALRFCQNNMVSLKTWLGIAATTAALLYTIPSNAYFIGAVICLIPFVAEKQKKSVRPVMLFESALMAGMLLALVFYLPVLSMVLHNEYTATGRAFQAAHFKMAGEVLYYFFSWRFLLLLLLATGWYLGYKSDRQQRLQLILLTGLLLLPFVFSAIRGDQPPHRVFLAGLPVFALLCTAGWVFAKPPVWVETLGVVCCLVCYGASLMEVEHTLDKGLNEVVRFQDMNYNYYQGFYHPNLEYDQFQKKFGLQAKIILETSEPYDMPEYLRHKHIQFVPLDSIENCIRSERILYVSTRHPRNFIREMSKLDPAWDCTYMQALTRYPRIVVCRRK